MDKSGKRADSQIRKYIRNRIAELCSLNKVSEASLLNSIGKSGNYFNTMRRDKGAPSYDTLVDICNFFGISLSAFFKDDIKYPVKLNKMLKDLNTFDPEELDTVESVIRQIKKLKNQ
jgi:transcriptional regulator with XRE-family HTH domain